MGQPPVSPQAVCCRPWARLSLIRVSIAVVGLGGKCVGRLCSSPHERPEADGRKEGTWCIFSQDMPSRDTWSNEFGSLPSVSDSLAMSKSAGGRALRIQSSFQKPRFWNACVGDRFSKEKAVTPSPVGNEEQARVSGHTDRLFRTLLNANRAP